SKLIFKGKGVLSLYISDLFNEHDFVVRTKYLDQDSSIFSNLDNRYIRLGFRYKFGNTKLDSNERALSQEERERLSERN
ncbi:MAG: outer membrane beta-barrel family protein, partial [Bacteroidia bacterium]|nr:outer membrane beta-barrel family protein [Bacteroidia bacterium]